MTDSDALALADAGSPDFGKARSKVVTRYDPLVPASAAGMTGLQFLLALRDGKLPPPPIAPLVGMNPTSVETSDVVFTCLPDESLYHPIGVVHGGLVCTLLDTVAACAVHSTLPADVDYTSVEIKVNYLRPVLAGVRPGHRILEVSGDGSGGSVVLVGQVSSPCRTVFRRRLGDRTVAAAQ